MPNGFDFDSFSLWTIGAQEARIAGGYRLDSQLIFSQLGRPLFTGRMSFDATSPLVVIIGAGFGGLSAAKQLARTPFNVTIVDRHNYHLFQPLLYQVATAGLSPGDIASPIRGILRRQKNAKVILAKVAGIDTRRSEVLAEGHRIPYDYLVVATGAEHAYFGHDWSSYVPGLRTIDDASAVAQIGAFKVSRLVAWLLWSLAHIYFLIGFRNRLAVVMNWCWNYVTFQRGTRLITGIQGSHIEDVTQAVIAAPPLTVSAEISASMQAVKGSQLDNFIWQESPQHA
jgi:hypothetical protein